MMYVEQKEDQLKETKEAMKSLYPNDWLVRRERRRSQTNYRRNDKWICNWLSVLEQREEEIERKIKEMTGIQYPTLTL